jgi:hypothetical protein
MKKFGLFLMVVAVIALSVATSQAALISLYGFEEGSGTTAANSVSGQQTGTLAGAATWGAGMIGDGAYSNPSAADDPVAGYLDIAGSSVFACDAFGTNAGAFWTGTWSVWVNPGELPATPGLYWVTYESGLRFSWEQDDTWFKWESVHDGDKYLYRHTGTADWTNIQDGNWHLLTYSYNLTTGASGTGSGTFYLDGSAMATPLDYNRVTSDLAFGAKSTHTLFTTDPGDPASTWLGLADDAANWDVQLSATEVAALNNLGRDTLNYGAEEATKLFDLYAAGGQAVIGGQLWEKVDSGLGDVGGAVIDHSALNLGGLDGSGVQVIPEPGTLTLLGAALVGLLVFAWRKRK